MPNLPTRDGQIKLQLYQKKFKITNYRREVGANPASSESCAMTKASQPSLSISQVPCAVFPAEFITRNEIVLKCASKVFRVGFFAVWKKEHFWSFVWVVSCFEKDPLASWVIVQDSFSSLSKDKRHPCVISTAAERTNPRVPFFFCCIPVREESYEWTFLEVDPGVCSGVFASSFCNPGRLKSIYNPQLLSVYGFRDWNLKHSYQHNSKLQIRHVSEGWELRIAQDESFIFLHEAGQVCLFKSKLLFFEKFPSK